MRSIRPLCALVVVAAVLAGARRPAAQSRPLVAPAAEAIYERLLAEIDRIKIFDHHAHPGFAGDPEIDPAPVPPGAMPLRLRPDNPDWAAAAHVLFGFPFADVEGAHGKWLADKKARVPPHASGPAVLRRDPRQAGHRDVDGQPDLDEPRSRSRALQVGVLHRRRHVSVRQLRARLAQSGPGGVHAGANRARAALRVSRRASRDGPRPSASTCRS